MHCCSKAYATISVLHDVPKDVIKVMGNLLGSLWLDSRFPDPDK
jgi:hypothetical protein